MKNENIRLKLYEDYEVSLFKLIMHDLAEKEGALLLAEKEKLNNDPESTPSLEAVRRYSQQLNVRIKKDRALAVRQRLFKILSRSVIAMLAVAVILGTTVASVEALRVRALNLWLEIKPEYTSFQLIDSGSNSDYEGSDSTSPPVGWNKAYVPTYIPDGYTVGRIIDHEFYKKIIYENEQGRFILYSELGEGSNAAVDTENADVFKTISINGHQGTLIEKNALVTLVWAMNNRMFIVQAQTDVDTAMKIAAGVKYVE